MRKLFLGFLTVVFLMSFASVGQCWTLGKKKEASPATVATTENTTNTTKQEAVKGKVATPAVKAQEPSKISQKELDKIRLQRDKKRNELNNFQWDIDITAVSGKGEKRRDAIIFGDNRFSSDEFSKNGFQPSNYTLTIQDSGAVVIETMQMGEKEGVLFWRVEFDNALNNCRGVFSRQLANGKGEDYSFVSITKKPFINKPVVSKAEEVVKK